jgi:hypothetical protein
VVELPTNMEHLKMDITLNLMMMTIMATKKEKGNEEGRKIRERREKEVKFTKR